MPPKQKQKIELILLKNNKKTKSNLSVKPTITYQELLKKMTYFTNKQFTLEVISNEDSSSQPLYEESLKGFLANYKGELINIVTTNTTMSNISSKPEPSTVFSDQTQNMKVEESRFIINEQQKEEIIKGLEGTITEKLKQLANESINIRRHQIEEAKYDKICSQCSKSLKGAYYLCLKCPNQFILCAECQQIQTDYQLVHHKYRAHPFTKVKPYKHKVKTVTIQTVQPEHIAIDQYQQLKIKENAIKAQLKNREEGVDVHDLIRMKLDQIMIHL